MRFANWDDRLERVKFFIKNNGYIPQCVELTEFKDHFRVSERELAEILGLSKTQIHRMIKIGRLDKVTLHRAMEFGVDKYVLIHLAETKNKKLENAIIFGLVRKYKEAKTYGKAKV